MALSGIWGGPPESSRSRPKGLSVVTFRGLQEYLKITRWSGRCGDELPLSVWRISALRPVWLLRALDGWLLLPRMRGWS